MSVKLVIMALPPSGNVLRRKYRDHRAYARLRGEWSRNLHYSAAPAARDLIRKMCAGPSKVAVKIIIHHKRLYDTDNAYASVKPMLDSMKLLGWIFDDSLQYCELTVEQEKCNDVRTTIIISPADAASGRARCVAIRRAR
jgi:hypothetical protein